MRPVAASQNRRIVGGLPFVGDPDAVAGQMAQLTAAGLTGIAVSFVNYLDELPYFCAEVLPRLARLGHRRDASPVQAQPAASPTTL